MYTFSTEARAALENLQQPLAIYQLMDGQVTTLLVSDGFCRLLGYTERDAAVYDMDHDMYKDTHPDDRERIIAAAERFMMGDNGEYDVVFRTKAGIESDYQVVTRIHLRPCQSVLSRSGGIRQDLYAAIRLIGRLSAASTGLT